MADVPCCNLDKALGRAEALCRDRGVRLTRQRRRVLEIVCAAGRPVGAYEVLESLREAVPGAAPPAVYRALEFLLEQGFVHRLETLHAYLGCHHPGHRHAGQFLICTECGGVTELEDPGISSSVSDAAAATGFQARRPVVEVAGTCAGCARGSRDQ